MPAPWVAGAQGRIVGSIHGQQTVNVLNFATNSAILDQGALDTLLLALATALLDCAFQALLPAVTSDWKLVSADARRIYPSSSDPLIQAAGANQVGALSATSVSFAASLVNIRTGSGGKSGRGRMFLPPPGEAEISASGMDSNTQNLLYVFTTCLAGKFMGVSPSEDWRLGVLSKKELAATGGTFDNSFRQATSLNIVANLACLRSRKVGHGA
jgi:hypothetical protein